VENRRFSSLGSEVRVRPVLRGLQRGLCGVAIAILVGSCAGGPPEPPAPPGPDVDLVLAKGRSLEREGRLLAAMDAYRVAIRADPARLESHLLYQDLVLARGDHALLREEYARYSTGNVRLDVYLRIRIRPDPGREAGLRALAATGDPLAARAAIDLARLLLAQGRYEEALEAAGEALTLTPFDPDVHLVRARALEGLGRPEEAEKAYAEAAGRGADPAKAQAGRARVLLLLDRPRDASRALARIGTGRRGEELHLVRADVAAALEDTKELHDALEAALRANPENLATRRRLGLLLASLGETPKRALHLLRPMSGPESTDREALVASGELALATGRPAEAAAHLERAVELGAGEEIRLPLLRAWLRSGHPDRAADAAAESPAERLIRARARLALGRRDEAEADLRRLLGDEAVGDEAATDLALLLVDSERAEEALAVLEGRPDSSRVSAARGRVLLRLGRSEEAEAALRRAFGLGRPAATVFLDLAELSRRGRRTEERIRWLRSGRTAHPADTRFVLELARALGPGPEAEALVRGLLRADEPPLGAEVVLVELLLGRGQLEEGLRRALRMAERAPDDATARTALAHAYAAAGRPDEAEASYRRAIELDARCVDAHLGFGELLLGLGADRREEAAGELDRALAIDPWRVEARRLLGTLRLRQGKPDEAIEALAPLTEGPDPDPAALDLLARAEARRENREAAVQALRRLLRIRRKDPDVHYRLGVLYDELKKTGNAVYHLRRALEYGADESLVRPRIQRLIQNGR
jgi:tetratricopeptide (TPR) repeat protein